jgi:hypothetical protein
MASLAVVMFYRGRNYYECECEVVRMSNGRYAYKAVCDTGGHVFKFTTKSTYEMYCYNLTHPPDEVESDYTQNYDMYGECFTDYDASDLKFQVVTEDATDD